MGKRIVLDTNIIISAFGWGGIPRKILESIIINEHTLITTEQQLLELKRALTYPKLKLHNRQQEEILSVIRSSATIVESDSRIQHIKRDPDDDRILEAAVAGNATHIITGDNHLLEIEQYHDIKIITPRTFYEEIK